jgi:hypothetical protein
MKAITRFIHRLRARSLRSRAASIRLDLMLQVEAELSRERQLLARAAWHERRAFPQRKPAGLTALIPGARRISPVNIIHLPQLVRKEAA